MVWSPRPDSNRRPHPYQGCALPTELRGRVNGSAEGPSTWSGRRGSNSRHSAWKADALPTELLPRTKGFATSSHERAGSGWGRIRTYEARCAADLQSAPFGQLGHPSEREPKTSARAPIETYGKQDLEGGAADSKRQSWRWDSNPQPPDYKSGALPLSYASETVAKVRLLVDDSCRPPKLGFGLMERPQAQERQKRAVGARCIASPQPGCQHARMRRAPHAPRGAMLEVQRPLQAHDASRPVAPCTPDHKEVGRGTNNLRSAAASASEPAVCGSSGGPTLRAGSCTSLGFGRPRLASSEMSMACR
jgi:hypothetical protein